MAATATEARRPSHPPPHLHLLHHPLRHRRIIHFTSRSSNNNSSCRRMFPQTRATIICYITTPIIRWRWRRPQLSSSHYCPHRPHLVAAEIRRPIWLARARIIGRRRMPRRHLCPPKTCFIFILFVSLFLFCSSFLIYMIFNIMDLKSSRCFFFLFFCLT